MRHLLFLITAIAAAHGIEPVKHEGALYHVRRIPPGEHSRLELRWLDAAGQPLVHFGGLKGTSGNLTSPGRAFKNGVHAACKGA